MSPIYCTLINQVYFKLEKRIKLCDELDFFFYFELDISASCNQRESNLKYSTFSEFQTRYLKQGKISSSTRDCQKSSIDR